MWVFWFKVSQGSHKQTPCPHKSHPAEPDSKQRGPPRGCVAPDCRPMVSEPLSSGTREPLPSGLSPHQLSSELWGIREGTSRPGPEAQAGSRAVGDQAWEMGLRQLCVSSPVPLFHNPAVFLRFLSFPFKASPGAPALIQAPDLHRRLP